MHTVSWTGNKSYIPYHGPAINHAYRVMDRQYIIHTVSWTGNKSYIPYHEPAINHAYRFVTKSLHATTLKNGSPFARGNSCVLRLAFILRWGQRSFFFSQLVRHERVLNVFNMTNDTNYRMVPFLTKEKFKAVSPSALCN